MPLSTDAQTIDFDGKASRQLSEILNRNDSRKSGKGTVEIILLDDNPIPLVPTRDRYGSVHYTFTAGKTRAKINYACKNAPIDQPPWQVTVTIPANRPEVAEHNHALPEILDSQDCKGKRPNDPTICKPKPAAKYSWLVNGSSWEPSGTNADTVISPVLSKDSVFSLVMDIPQYATQMVAHVDFINCSGAEVDYLDVMVPGLIELPQSPEYILTGANSLHPFNHYGTTTTVNSMTGLATAWNEEHPDANKLVVNDMSLKWGGRFDVLGNWIGSHSNHSFGIAADISKRCVKKSNRGALILLMDKHGFDVWSEGDTIKEQNHYHIQHKQELERLRALNFPIEKDGRMKGDAQFEDDLYDNNGAGITPIQPPPLATRIVTDCVSLMKQHYPNPPYKCNEATKPNGTLGDGMTQPYCKCINLYTVAGTAPNTTLKLVSEKDLEPPDCGKN